MPDDDHERKDEPLSIPDKIFKLSGVACKGLKLDAAGAGGYLLYFDTQSDAHEVRGELNKLQLQGYPEYKGRYGATYSDPVLGYYFGFSAEQYQFLESYILSPSHEIHREAEKLQAQILLGEKEEENAQVTALAIKYLYSKNCEVRICDDGLNLYVEFDNPEDMQEVKNALCSLCQKFDIPKLLPEDGYPDDKYFLLTYEHIYIIYQEDFDKKAQAIRALLNKQPSALSAHTKKHVQKQLDLIEHKRQFGKYSSSDVLKFQNELENLPMPMELKIAIGTFLGAAFLFAAIATIPAGVAVASTLAAVSAGSGSMWLFGRGRKGGADETDQAEIKAALKGKGPDKAI